MIPSISSIKKLSQWKEANQRLIDDNVTMPIPVKEQERNKKSLRERTMMYKLNTQKKDDIYGHLAEEDLKVKEDFIKYSNLAGKTMKDYCACIFKDKKDTLWTKLNRMGLKICELVACKEVDIDNEDDKHFQFKFLIPGTIFKETIDLEREQYPKVGMQINAYKCFLKFLSNKVSGI